MPAERSRTVGEILTSAVALHRSGQGEEAEALYRHILELEPANADALHLSGVVAHQAGRHADAADLIAKAIKKAPRNPSFRLNLAHACQALGHPDKAAIEKAIKLDPGWAEAHNSLGVVRTDQERLSRAIGHFNKAIALKPDYADAHNNLGIALAKLGKLEEALEAYQQPIKLPFGMVLVSGPTGSGKTTTLYASLNQLDTTARNILTIEDPVEYRFGKINQMQVNVQAGMTFASGLRAAMRLDPDVILVGEIRDQETASTAVQAALTGHLVLSSVHANDAAGVIFRLIDLGVEPFLIASAVGGVIAQRMVRQICPNCAAMAPVLSEERLAYEKEMNEERTEFLYGSGCNYCAQTGYLGRTGIFEVMNITEAIRRLILTGASADDIRAQAAADGTISLWRDGMLKVNDGETTPYEVIRNVFTIS